MIKNSPTKKLIIFTICLLALVFSGKFFTYFFSDSARADSLDFSNSAKEITIMDNDFSFVTQTRAITIAEALSEKDIKLSPQDETIPEKDTLIYPGIKIQINRAIKIKIQVDNKTLENYSTAKTISGTLGENNLVIGRLDKVSPDMNSRPQSNATIVVTRINIEEKTVTEDIDFKTTTNTDSKLGWQEKKITQAGAKGSQETKYKITYKNGQEVSRVILEKNIIQPPTAQIVTQGTYMQLGKADKGQGTWYSFQGGLFAASTSIPKGSYAKVTNLASGKSVVVQINDYGPQGKGRIIDLDKVAFQKIAAIGAGVIGVKVEPILN